MPNRNGGSLSAINLNSNEKKLTDSLDLDFVSLYETIFNATAEALLIIDAAGEIIMLSKNAQKLLKIEAGQEEGSLLDRLKSVPAEVFRAQLECIAAQGSLEGEWETYIDSDHLSHIQFSGSYNHGHYFFTLTDVTPHKEIEKNYLIWTSLFKDVFRQVTDGFIIMDKNGIIQECNGPFLAKVGVRKADILYQDFRKFVCKEIAYNWQENWKIIKEQGNIKRTIVTALNGKKHYFEYHTFWNSYNSHTITVLQDITDQRQMEMELKQSQEIFEHMYHQALEAIIITNEKGNVLQVNDSAAKLFEVEPEEFLGMQVTDFFPKKGKKFTNMLRKFYRNGKVREQMFLQTAKGNQKMVEYTSKIIEGLDMTLTIYRDNSYRYEMENRIKKSEKRFRTIFNEMPVGLILWHGNSFYDVNEAGQKIFKTTKENLLNHSIDELLAMTLESEEAVKTIHSQINSKKNHRDILHIRFPAGEVKHLEFTTKKNLVSNLHLTIIEDLTETLEIQERLRKSDTLNVVGELAAGIAHEIRNPMTALKGFIQLLEGSVSDSYANYFSIINSELKRIDEIITDFLVLAKPQATRHAEKDIKEIMKETIGLMQAEAILYNVQFRADYNDEPFLLYCEPNQLKQVFINVIKNAVEAMKETGGSVSISILPGPEESISIKIEDQGKGIPQEKLKRLGEPFYTTKERGTGLGLMVSYKIIEEHGGHIDVESELGKGTAFTIMLPVRKNGVEHIL